jgi:hypothetical protein
MALSPYVLEMARPFPHCQEKTDLRPRLAGNERVGVRGGPGMHPDAIEIGDNPHIRKEPMGFLGDLLGPVAAGDVGQQQLPDTGVTREPACRGSGQVPAGASEFRVAFEKSRLDHKRVGAAHRLEQACYLLDVANNGELGADSSRSANHLRCDPATVGEQNGLAVCQRGALRPLWHTERIEALGQQRKPHLFLKQVAEALGGAMRDWESLEAPARSR